MRLTPTVLHPAAAHSDRARAALTLSLARVETRRESSKLQLRSANILFFIGFVSVHVSTILSGCLSSCIHIFHSTHLCPACTDLHGSVA